MSQPGASVRDMLRVDEDFTPCPVDDGDELFPNGIFVFNVTRMLEWIDRNQGEVLTEDVAVGESFGDFSSITESHMDSVELGQPVVLAEISPGRYNLIDGHHRMEKARRSGTRRIPAHKLDPKQHVRFLTSRKAYRSYVEYWNSKLEDPVPDGR